jgi:hypothetical protein
MSVSAHVQKNSLNKDGFTEYFILILYKGSEWAIRKRYSDFVQFDLYLQQSGYDVQYKLPEKNFWSRLDPTLISKRMTELQNYLASLLQNTLCTDNSLIREFLEVDEHVLALAIKQKRLKPNKETTYEDRLDLIVKDARKTMLYVETISRTNANRPKLISRTRHYSLMPVPLAPSSSTPPSSPLHRGGSFVSSRSTSFERKALANGGHSQSGNSPHGSFSVHGSSTAQSERSFVGVHLVSRESRDSRLSSLNQAASRFLLGSSSGQSTLDAAFALEDLQRKEAFSSHVSKTWASFTNAEKKQSRDVRASSQRPEKDKKCVLPVPYTQEHENEYCRQSGGRVSPRMAAESESDIEGGMFRDDSNSFVLDVLSSPVLSILTAHGLALHEELDVQADAFVLFRRARNPRHAPQWESCCVFCDWCPREMHAKCEVIGKSDGKGAGRSLPTEPIGTNPALHRARSKSEGPNVLHEHELGADTPMNAPLQLRRINSDAIDKKFKAASLQSVGAPLPKATV